MDFEKNMNFISYILSRTHTILKVQLPAGQGRNAPEKRSADISPYFILCIRDFVDIRA